MRKHHSGLKVQLRPAQVLPALRLGVSSVALLAMTPLLLWAGTATAQTPELTDLELLGKHFFFDERLSTPRQRQGCVSCHNPAMGWVLPDPEINQTTVVAPGASPGARGVLKTPSNAYAPRIEFRPTNNPFAPIYEGGNFWDGRAEGCAEDDCQIGENATTTITEDVIPPEFRVDPYHYEDYLGPVADQALNPTSRPGVEQNTRVQNVCNLVKTGPYADVYEDAWGEPIDCHPTPRDNPPYNESFQRLAIAVSAWQASPDVNSFTSTRDDCIRDGGGVDDPFTDCLTDQEKRGHDLFYGITSDVNPTGKNARCSGCHDSTDGEDSLGNFLENTYADHGFHNLGIPYNREIPTTVRGQIVGLSGHLGDEAPTTLAATPGFFKTPTVRNVGKNEGDIDDIATKSNKAFMHNGYLKSLVEVAHFYNTSRVKPRCEDLDDPIEDATAEEAIANDCWPLPELGLTGVAPPNIVGNLGLTCPDARSDATNVNGQDICTVPEGQVSDEEALVLYLRTLTDAYTPAAP